MYIYKPMADPHKTLGSFAPAVRQLQTLPVEMNKLLVIFAALLAGAWAYNRYEPSYVRFETSEEDEDYSRARPYGFEYDVKDGPTNFGHRQQSDGRVTSGSYRVQLPDGRTQVVTYRADENGYNAQVTYEPTSDYIGSITPTHHGDRPAAPPVPLIYRNVPLYQFPAIAPYHGPSNAYGAYDQSGNDRGPAARSSADQQEDDSDEELPSIIPLIFRDRVEPYSRSSGSRSGYGKRSTIAVWSEADISAALDAPDAEAATEASPAHEEIDFDRLPNPLPLPLAFRP